MKNFANFSEITCNISPDVTYLVGQNGSGKSTLGITAIWACLRGIAEKGNVLKGKRFNWIGPASNEAEVSIVLRDDKGEYKISRKITKDSQSLEITSPTGEKLDQKFIDEFWNDLMLSPIAFSKLTPKEQAKHLGIDTSEFDTKIAELKEEATFIRREVKNFGEIEVPEKVEPVDVSELNQEKNRIIQFNQEQDLLRRQYNEISGKIGSAQEQIERKRKEIEALEQAIKDLEMSAEQLPNPQHPIETDGIDQKISEASSINAKAAAYKAACEKEEQKALKEQGLSENLEQQKAQVEAKIRYCQELDLPFSNLSIDDDGSLLMDGRPISPPHFSTGELIKICCTLLSSRSPQWKYVFLEQFDLLDEQKAEEVLSWLSEHGFQVVVEKVGKQMDGENVIILSNGTKIQ